MKNIAAFFDIDGTLFRNGQYHDEILMGLLREEYNDFLKKV